MLPRTEHWQALPQDLFPFAAPVCSGVCPIALRPDYARTTCAGGLGDLSYRARWNCVSSPPRHTHLDSYLAERRHAQSAAHHCRRGHLTLNALTTRPTFSTMNENIRDPRLTRLPLLISCFTHATLCRLCRRRHLPCSPSYLLSSATPSHSHFPFP